MSVKSEYAVTLSGNQEDTITYVSLDEDQYNDFISIISDSASSIVSSQNKTRKDINNNYANIVTEITKVQSENSAILQSINQYQQCVSSNSASLNSDIVEMQYVQTFFLSLILGLLVTILFFNGLKKG